MGETTPGALASGKANWVPVGNASWCGRDSAGETVYDGKLWIFGGWISSHVPALQDVWTSADGMTWTEVQPEAPWAHSDLPMSITFKNRMWMMGGYDLGRLPNATASNLVWSSTDGVEWTNEGPAGWSPRLAAGIVEHDGKMWVLGGLERYLDGTPQHLRNDVWYSEDGQKWIQATSDAGWAPRAFHNALSYNGRIYIFGGGNYQPQPQEFNDVWSSSDGVNWRKETSEAPWLPRIWASAVVYRDKMWLLGGYTLKDGKGNLNDVWTSTDGATWTQASFDVIWGPRHEMSAYVQDDKIWIMGGFDGKELHNDVWSLHLP